LKDVDRFKEDLLAGLSYDLEELKKKLADPKFDVPEKIGFEGEIKQIRKLTKKVAVSYTKFKS